MQNLFEQTGLAPPPMLTYKSASYISMNWIFIIIGIVVVALIAFWYLRPRSDESRVNGPIVFRRDEARAKTQVNVFDIGQLARSSGNNLTFGFFLYMKDVDNDRYDRNNIVNFDFRLKPLVSINGIGSIAVNPVAQTAKVFIQPHSYRDASVVDINSLPIARWNQIIITIEGRTVDVYVNGALVGSTLAPNVPNMKASDVSLMASPDFSGQAALFQLWPRRLTADQVARNYTRNTDLRGKPTVPDIEGGLSFTNAFGHFKQSLCDIGFCGFRFEVGPLQYVDYEFA